MTLLFAISALVAAPAYGIETKCVVTGPAASYLKAIGIEAADAQQQAEEIKAYMRNGTPDWRSVGDQMSYLVEHIRHIQRLISRLESMEPTLTPAQREQFEQLEAGYATLVVFANATNELVAERQLTFKRHQLETVADAMSARAGMIRDAARKLRTAATA